MVHGAGNDLWGPASIKSRWFPALADGLAWHGVELDPADVRIAFYGDLFREDPRAGLRAAGRRGGGHRHIESVVKGLDPNVDLAELTKLLTENHYDRLLAQAAAYLQQPEVRAAARARVEAAVGPDTRVVVAHSLGTLVAYETLCAHPEWAVTDFVTIGCPLAGDMIHAQLDPGPDRGRRRVARGGADLDQHRRPRRPGGPQPPVGPLRRGDRRVQGRQRAPGPRPRALPQQLLDRSGRGRRPEPLLTTGPRAGPGASG